MGGQLLLRRLAAYAIDCVLLFTGLIALQALLYRINPIVRVIESGQPVDPVDLHAWVFATATLPFLVYFAVTIASRRQATVAMRWLGLRVTSIAGTRIGIGRALVRSGVLLVPFELNHALMFHAGSRSGPGLLLYAGIAAVWLIIGVYVALAVASPIGQSVHDRVAGTMVSGAR